MARQHLTMILSYTGKGLILYILFVFYIFPAFLKETVSQDGYFLWRAKHLNQYFLCLRWWFSRCSKSFSLPYIIINFLLLLWNYLPQSRQSAKLFLQSSELGLPHPSPAGEKTLLYATFKATGSLSCTPKIYFRLKEKIFLLIFIKAVLGSNMLKKSDKNVNKNFQDLVR